MVREGVILSPHVMLSLSPKLTSLDNPARFLLATEKVLNRDGSEGVLEG